MRADLIKQLRDAADSAHPYNTAMVPAQLLRQAVLELSSTPAPQPASSGESQRAGVTLTWDEAQAISDVPEVHEAADAVAAARGRVQDWRSKNP